MKTLVDLLPVFLFVAVLAWADAHPTTSTWRDDSIGSAVAVEAGARAAPALLATAVGVLAVFAHFGWQCWRGRRATPALVAGLVLVTLLALAAIGLRGPAFDPWRPSAMYWLIGLALWLARVVLGRNLLRMLLGHRLDLPDAAWQRLNAIWVGFFGVMGLLNLWVAYSVPEEIWQPFKVFGGIALLLVFTLAQSPLVSRRPGGDAPTTRT